MITEQKWNCCKNSDWIYIQVFLFFVPNLTKSYGENFRVSVMKYRKEQL